MAQLNFNAHEVAPDQGREAIPAGWYIGIITKSEIKQTKEKKGWFLEVAVQVDDGIYKGSVVTERFNFQNKSAEAEKIGKAQLSALCHAVNVMVMEDSLQLHNIPFKFKVAYKPAEGTYAASNEVSLFKPLTYVIPAEEANIPPAPVTGQPWVNPTAPAPAPAAQPWAPQPAAAPAPAQPWQAPAPQPQQAPAQPWAQQPAAPVQQAPTAPVQPWQQPAAPAPAPQYQQAPAQPAAQPWQQPAAPVAPAQQFAAQPQPAPQQGPAGDLPPWMSQG